MGHFEMIKRDGSIVPLFSREPFCTVKSAVQNISMMGDDYVQLSIVSSELIEFDKGDKIVVFGEEYSIRTKVTRNMLSDSHYEYDATFYGVMYDLMKIQYRNADAQGKSTTSTFDLTYSLKDFIRVLIYNAERDYPGVWLFDEASCPETDPKTLQFSKQNCLQVLQTLCNKENFNLDFRISQSGGVRTIHVGKFGSVITPPDGRAFFEWGKGNGLYQLNEGKVDDKSVITRLWIEGGSNNIRSGYRDYSSKLQLPYPKRLNAKAHTMADGTEIAAGSEMIGIDDDTKRYIEDSALRASIGSDEDSIEYANIYPCRTGEVTAIDIDDVNSFVDSSMDFDLMEKDAAGETKYLVGGVTAKINFITGRLAGQQFELEAKVGYEHVNKKFKIIPYTDERGLTIPTTGTNEAYRIAVGDKYKITDITLPESYIKAAEEELWYAGMDDFKVRSQVRAQYSLTLDRQYLISSLPSDSDAIIFHVGDYVPIKDVRFKLQKNIRIQKISRNLMLEQDYSLTLSDVTAISVGSQTVVDVIEHNKIIEMNNLRDPNKARHNWRTTEELKNMVYDPDGYFDAGNIRPNSIDTNMLTVGTKSQQFYLQGVIFEANASGQADHFTATGGLLVHLSIDDTKVRTWKMGVADYNMKLPGGYYLFAKCAKGGDVGVWYLTQEQLSPESDSDPNNYYFLTGIISSRYQDGFRDFVATHGFTRINGRVVTTGRIASADGATYFDLDNSEICGRILFKRADGSNKTIDELGFDNTQTAIDGGIVTSGTLQVSGNKTDVLAGMTGDGVSPSSVRFWAGVPFVSRANAPFRVLQSGDTILTKLHAIGAEIYNERDDRMSRMTIVGNQIIGKTKGTTDLIISNEYNPGLSSLDSNSITIPASVNLHDGFKPQFTEAFIVERRPHEVEFEFQNCELINYVVGYVPATSKITLTGNPEIRWVYPHWLAIEDGLSEYTINNLNSADFYLWRLELWLCVDGIKKVKLAGVDTSLNGSSGIIGQGGGHHITLTNINNSVLIDDGGIVSFKLICPDMTVIVNDQDYDLCDPWLISFVNGTSYPIDVGGDWVHDPFFIAEIESWNMTYVPPVHYNGLMGFTSFRNGFLHKNKVGLIKFNEDVFSVNIGSTILELSKTGIRKSVDGGLNWQNL